MQFEKLDPKRMALLARDCQKRIFGLFPAAADVILHVAKAVEFARQQPFQICLACVFCFYIVGCSIPDHKLGANVPFITKTNSIVFPSLLSVSNSVLAENAEYTGISGSRVIFFCGKHYQSFEGAILNSNVLNYIGITMQQLRRNEIRLDAMSGSFAMEYKRQTNALQFDERIQESQRRIVMSNLMYRPFYYDLPRNGRDALDWK